MKNSASTKKIFNEKKKSFNYEEDDMPEEIVKTNPVDLLDEILEIEDKEPKDKRLKAWAEWKILINEKMKNYNKIAGQKIFKLL